MPQKKMRKRTRFLHGLALLVLGPLASWLAFGLFIAFQDSPHSLRALSMTWAYWLGITAIPMIFGLVFVSFVRPVYAWIAYALGSAFMVYGQVTLNSMSATNG
ncbi:hypothetical protein [Stenotrophomonas maltophilia]|uniref:hypothetical protein n=1 Tax=Stenotrophomonas maltophilia TaxID=40324 RepID=UPI000C15E9A9|nr:hypothetical protein [Stenotrophomonas maltophilia]